MHQRALSGLLRSISHSFNFMHEALISISHPLIVSACLRNAHFFPSLFQASHSDRLWPFRNNSSPFNLILICRVSEKHQLSSPPMNLQCTSIFPPFSMPANSFHGNSGFEGSITSVKLLQPSAASRCVCRTNRAAMHAATKRYG